MSFHYNVAKYLLNKASLDHFSTSNGPGYGTADEILSSGILDLF